MHFLIHGYKEVTRDLEVPVTFTSGNGAVPRPTASLTLSLLLNSMSPNESSFIHTDYWGQSLAHANFQTTKESFDSPLPFPDQNHTRNLLTINGINDKVSVPKHMPLQCLIYQHR